MSLEIIMFRFIVFTGVVGFCWAVTVSQDDDFQSSKIQDLNAETSSLSHSYDGLGFGGGLSLGHGDLTLGEISLHDEHHHDLPTISLSDSDGHSFGGISHGSLWNEAGTWSSDDHDESNIFKVKKIGIPVVKEVKVPVPHPVVQSVPQPYPVAVIIPKPVPYEVVKQVFQKVEKKVPTPVHKIIPYPVTKHVPYKVVKHVPVHITKPYPIKIPIYKTIVHKVGGHHHRR